MKEIGVEEVKFDWGRKVQVEMELRELAVLQVVLGSFTTAQLFEKLNRYFCSLDVKEIETEDVEVSDALYDELTNLLRKYGVKFK